MSRKHYDFTSESVSEGHPDKVADRISDEIVDLYFRESVKDGMSPWDIRVAAETLTTTNKVIIAGETRGSDRITPEMIIETARAAIKDIGYEQEGFHWKHADIDVLLHAQSADIAQGVDQGDGPTKEEGAGDQGIMFGYACSDTEDFMPAPVYYSHKILERLAKARKEEGVTQLGPDSKAQVTVAYRDRKPVHAKSIVLSTQHLDASLNSADIAKLVKPYVYEVLPDGWITEDTIWHINPTGKFVIGGPDGDTGLTGRKIIVDTYGGMAPHGGGAFSGKDSTKVDRSAAYATRYLAKNIVAAGLAPWVDIQLSYAIGVATPTSIYVNVDDANDVSGDVIERICREVMDLTPRGIRKHLNLNQPIFARTAAYGHFGRKPDADGGFSWEKTDLVEAIRAAL
ncbi:methionine adenosyltransferase [Litorimonas taeanensis]|uniref:Methionine adenosyltransferase n=1 Tax=Litorimonas taeanensis TaxID=568099 RepID=A0A420WDK5_9PROT|nr:methionine adenosyltransferase [Litorimonas taeanensis]RKQ69076.1 methionine adenosyltransferase [Litorimonas taeanensis]